MRFSLSLYETWPYLSIFISQFGQYEVKDIKKPHFVKKNPMNLFGSSILTNES